MKKFIGFIGIFLCLLFLTACTQMGKLEAPLVVQKENVNSNSVEEKKAQVTATKTKLPDDTVIMKGKIVDTDKNKILVVDCDADASPYALYWVSLSKSDIYGMKGESINAKDLKAGMRIDMAYNGTVLESYPAQTGAYRITVTKQGEDLLGFYLSVIKDLYNVDPALNADISMLAFNLNKTTNLSEAEKNALLYLCSNTFEIETIQGTYEELCKQGYIDKKKMYFENGILITIDVKKEKKNSFVFDIQKWRSGLGAYYYIDCTAKRKNGEWSYKIGSEAIS